MHVHVYAYDVKDPSGGTDKLRVWQSSQRVNGGKFNVRYCMYEWSLLSFEVLYCSFRAKAHL